MNDFKISQYPYWLVPILDIYFFFIKEFKHLCTVFSDFPIIDANSFFNVLGFSLIFINIVFSSLVKSPYARTSAWTFAWTFYRHNGSKNIFRHQSPLHHHILKEKTPKKLICMKRQKYPESIKLFEPGILWRLHINSKDIEDLLQYSEKISKEIK